MELFLVGLGFVNLLGLIYLITRRGGAGLDGALRQEFAQSRREAAEAARDLRTEVVQNIHQSREALDRQLELLRRDNSDKLEKMRATVDEKLQSILEKRLGESFKMVSERLEQVHKGLGEMQNLATDVSDFKRVLTNVKTRGTWGEVQLESLLDQVFIKDHYDKQVMLSSGSRDAVDFAIKLPDKGNKKGYIYLPIDAKFPLEDYQRLVAAEEKNDLAQAAIEQKAMVARIKLEAKSIKEKYILPPRTTDFAVLYVPIESMYAAVLSTPGLFEQLQSQYRVTVAGPTTIAAILSSYQLGFRTLAIAEQTSHVWETLTDIRSEFGKFGDLLDKTREKLVQATNTIDLASRKSRTLEGRLTKAQLLADKASAKAETAAENAVDDTPRLIDVK